LIAAISSLVKSFLCDDGVDEAAPPLGSSTLVVLTIASSVKLLGLVLALEEIVSL
jgi:hypothetical protein